MLDLDDRAVDQVALVELGQRAVDHRIHLLVGDVLEVDDGRVFDVGQNGPLSILLIGDLRHDYLLLYHVRLCKKLARAAV